MEVEKMITELVYSAEAARTSAYSPYSGVTVGAALLCKSGNMYLGANIENSSYGATICAERVAFSKAVNAGERDFAAIAIAGGERGKEVTTSFEPCGICRQFMAEFCDKDFKIAVVTADGYELYTLEQLLPYSFGKDKLQ